MLSLRQCFDRHDCDRGKRHGYERVYEPLFEMIRHEPLRLLEIGILNGAGIAAWLDYFPKAYVFGLDTFQRVPANQVEILRHWRVEYETCDSTQAVPLNLGTFDIIFDDGNHTAAAQLATWRNYRPLCRGLYFIEDCWPGKPGFEELVAALTDPIHHDLRGCVDSYILQC
jgi:hypothetical protein